MFTNQWRAAHLVERFFANLKANISVVPHLEPVRAMRTAEACRAHRMPSESRRPMCTWGDHDRRQR